MKRGEIILINHLGERQIRQARKQHICKGWEKRGGHTIQPGELYVETELSDSGNPWTMDKSCLDCLQQE